MTTQRVGGRMLLIDPHDRLLLIHERLEDVDELLHHLFAIRLNIAFFWG